MTAAPTSAADAYTSIRRTAGTLFSNTSRIAPPPVAVTAPRSTAETGVNPYRSDLLAPDTANRDNPPASKIIRNPDGILAIGSKITNATTPPRNAKNR